MPRFLPLMAVNYQVMQFCSSVTDSQWVRSTCA